MGYYLQPNQTPKGKVESLVNEYEATLLPLRPETFDDVPEDKALICVIDNGPFEAAALMFDEDEYKRFLVPDDVGPSTIEGPIIHMRSDRQRPRSWLIMDKEKAHELAGYQEE